MAFLVEGNNIKAEFMSGEALGLDKSDDSPKWQGVNSAALYCIFILIEQFIKHLEVGYMLCSSSHHRINAAFISTPTRE